MTAAARKADRVDNINPKAAARPSPLAVFTARCEARATLWQVGEIDLHDAVDELQAAAVRDGLVAALGQDSIQELMVGAFAPVRDDFIAGCDQVGTDQRLTILNAVDDPWSAPSWHDAAVEYHRKRADQTLVVEIEPERQVHLAHLLGGGSNTTSSLERTFAEVSKPTGLAASTIKAADHLVRAGDAEPLQLWLAKHSADERIAIQKHLGGKHVAEPATD